MHEAQKELHALMVSSSGEFATAVFNAKDALKSARAELVAAAKLNSQAMDSLDAARDRFAEAKKEYKDSKTADLKAAVTEAKTKLSAEEVLRKAARDRLRAAKSASMSASGALAMLKRRPPAY
jgi:predicted enzyme involved in methoxymalonyl-ACP biosynthesis